MAIKDPVGDVAPPSHEQDGHFPLDRVTFGVAAGLAVAFLVWGTVDSTGMGTTTGEVLGWLTTSFGWLFILVSASFLLFSAYLAVTRYGNIKLGPDDSEPEFSTFSWVSLMKSLRTEPYESNLPPRVRRAVQHAQQYDSMEHHTVALAGYGAEPEEVTATADDSQRS